MMEVSSRIVADRVDANGDLFPRAVLEKAIEAAPGVLVYNDFGGRKVGRVTSARLDDAGRLMFSVEVLPGEQMPLFTMPPPEVAVTVRVVSACMPRVGRAPLRAVQFLRCYGRDWAWTDSEDEEE